MSTVQYLQPAAAPPRPAGEILQVSSMQADENGQSCCAVCPHLVADHDPIGLRYCLATQQSVLPRGCICQLHN